MWKNYLTVALRALRKQKVYAFINVTGLAVGMGCCLLIFLLVQHEWSYDRFHERGDRIVRVLIQETRPSGEVAYRNLIQPSLAPEMEASFPGIEAGVRIVKGTLGVRHEGQVVHQAAVEADSTLFDVFSFPLAAGDPATALDDPQSVVLTAAAAERFFAAELGTYGDVVGRTLTVENGDDRHPFTVTGVLEPLPATSSLQFDFVLPFRQYETIRLGSNDWGGRTSLYLLLRDGRDREALEAALEPFTQTQLASHIEARRQAEYLADGPDALQFVLQPLSELHRSPEKPVNYEEPLHDPTYSYVLVGIALAVLLIACINFTTLAIGRSADRAREVGVRKALGAHRTQLMKQFWSEALLLSTLALGAGLLLTVLALPLFNALTGRPLGLASLGSAGGLLLLGLVVLVGLLAGGYPAVVLSRFEPARVLRGNASTRTRGRLTRGLVVAQYATSIGLIICTLVMYRQLDYLLGKDLGFDGEQVVVIQTANLSSDQQQRVLGAFRTELAAAPQVVDVVRTGYAFTYGYDGYGWTGPDGRPYSVQNVGVDYDYLDMLGMELVAGRDFSRDYPSDSTQSVLVNEAFVREYGLDDPVGTQLTGYGSYFGEVDPTIVGVVKDFNFESLHGEVRPTVLNMHPDYYTGMGAMLVKIRPDEVPATLALLERTWQRVFPEEPFGYSFLDEDMDALYQAEQRWSRTLTYAALLAVFIACLGLFGLATLTVARRTKEIGIRKVLGASVPGLAVLVAREFALLVATATVVAWPFAYLGMRRWLEGFAYRIDMPWWAFLAAGGVALAVALLTVSYQAARAALADPVRSLRYE